MDMLVSLVPFVIDIVAQGLSLSCVWETTRVIVGLAVAVVAYASQTAQLTSKDTPIAVILFALSSILLFTLPRLGGNSHLPHVIVLIFGFTTIVGFLFGS